MTGLQKREKGKDGNWEQKNKKRGDVPHEKKERGGGVVLKKRGLGKIEKRHRHWKRGEGTVLQRPPKKELGKQRRDHKRENPGAVGKRGGQDRAKRKLRETYCLALINKEILAPR